MLNFDITNLTPTRTLVVGALAISLLVPGHLILFLFKKDIYFSLDLFRLIMLSICIAVPILLINFTLIIVSSVISIKFIHKDVNQIDLERDALIASILTCFVLFSSALLGYLQHFKIRELMDHAFTAQLGLIGSFFFIGVINWVTVYLKKP